MIVPRGVKALAAAQYAYTYGDAFWLVHGTDLADLVEGRIHPRSKRGKSIWRNCRVFKRVQERMHDAGVVVRARYTNGVPETDLIAAYDRRLPRKGPHKRWR